MQEQSMARRIRRESRSTNERGARLRLALAALSVCAGQATSRAQTGCPLELGVLDSGGQQANLGAYAPELSSDGRYVSFLSNAANLAPGLTNGFMDAYVRDRVTGKVWLASVSLTGGDGDAHTTSVARMQTAARIVFESLARNLVPNDHNAVPGLPLTGSDIFVRDLPAGPTALVSVSSAGVQGNGSSRQPAWSGNGRFVAFASDSDRKSVV